MAWRSASEILVILVILTLHLANCDVCIRGNSTKGCYTAEDWRQNILCRIDGSDGYVTNTTSRQFDTPFMTNLKQQSASGFNQIKNTLRGNNVNVGTLRAAESSLMHYGRLLYGAVGWRHFDCSLVDANGRSNSPVVKCGDRKYSPPSCSLPTAQGSTSTTTGSNPGSTTGITPGNPVPGVTPGSTPGSGITPGITPGSTTGSTGAPGSRPGTLPGNRPGTTSNNPNSRPGWFGRGGGGGR